MFGALPVLRALRLTYHYDCARIIEVMSRSLTVLGLDGSSSIRSGFLAQNATSHLATLCEMLPDRCPQPAHVRLSTYREIADEDQRGRCGTLSIRNHAALEHLSSIIKDTLITGCVA